MKRTLILILFVVILVSMSAAAQANGTLSVTATVAGSVNLAFNSDASGLALTSGSGSNNAALGFGTIQGYGGVVPAGVTRTVTAGTSFTVSTPVDVSVTKYNSNSANYTLTAALGAADAVNTWTVGGVALTTTQKQITATGAYAATGAQAIALTVPFTSTTAAISNTINFVATAN
jgi:hypothetical protein